jgi:hypothetical protein
MYKYDDALQDPGADQRSHQDRLRVDVTRAPAAPRHPPRPPPEPPGPQAKRANSHVRQLGVTHYMKGYSEHESDYGTDHGRSSTGDDTPVTIPPPEKHGTTPRPLRNHVTTAPAAPRLPVLVLQLITVICSLLFADRGCSHKQMKVELVTCRPLRVQTMLGCHAEVQDRLFVWTMKEHL